MHANVPATWAAALAVCQAAGGRLAELHSSDEAAFASSQLYALVSGLQVWGIVCGHAHEVSDSRCQRG